MDFHLSLRGIGWLWLIEMRGMGTLKPKSVRGRKRGVANAEFSVFCMSVTDQSQLCPCRLCDCRGALQHFSLTAPFHHHHHLFI